MNLQNASKLLACKLRYWAGLLDIYESHETIEVMDKAIDMMYGEMLSLRDKVDTSSTHFTEVESHEGY